MNTNTESTTNQVTTDTIKLTHNQVGLTTLGGRLNGQDFIDGNDEGCWFPIWIEYVDAN